MAKPKRVAVGIAAISAAKTHCPQGHPYSPENTYVNPQGSRECRICHRRRSLAWWHRVKPRRLRTPKASRFPPDKGG